MTRAGLALRTAATVAALVLAGRWLAFAREGLIIAGLRRYGSDWVQRMPPMEAALLLHLLWLAPLMAVAGWWAVGWPRLDRVLEGLARRWRAAAGVAAVLATTLALLAGHLVLDRTPITDDEWAYLFHARVIAGGELTAESPPDREFYHNIFLVNDGIWCSQYPLGNPMLLAVGVLLGDPWIVPALLAGLTVLLLAGIARELFGPLAAAATAALAATSPFLLAGAGTLLSHVPALACLALFLWAGLRGTREGSSRTWVALAAVGFAATVLVRPSSAVVVGLAPTLLLWHRTRSLADGRTRRLVYIGAGTLLLGAWMALNQAAYGNPVLTGYHLFWEPIEGFRSPMGFGEFPWGIVHTPRAALGNAAHAAARLNAWLLGWPVSLLLPLAGLVLLRRRVPALLLAATAALPFAFHFFFFWPGIADVGPVLYAETMLALLPLSGAALAAGGPRWRRWAWGYAAAGVLLAPLVFDLPQARALALTARAAGEATAAAETVPGPALVFCPVGLRPLVQTSWCIGRPNPRPDLSDRVLFVLDHGAAENLAFWRRRHPERSPYRLEHRWGAGFELVPLEGSR